MNAHFERYWKAFLAFVAAEHELEFCHMPPDGYEGDPEIRYSSTRAAHGRRAAAVVDLDVARHELRIARGLWQSRDAEADSVFYVTAQDSGLTVALLGPFDDHWDALSVVPLARDLARARFRDASFAAFGTVSLKRGTKIHVALEV